MTLRIIGVASATILSDDVLVLAVVEYGDLHSLLVKAREATPTLTTRKKLLGMAVQVCELPSNVFSFSPNAHAISSPCSIMPVT